MTATNTIAPRAFAVWWKDLERWVIPTNVLLGQSLPPGWMRARIGTLVRQVTERVKAEPEKEYKMAGVKWYGEGVFHRETVRGDAMSASQVTPLAARRTDLQPTICLEGIVRRRSARACGLLCLERVSAIHHGCGSHPARIPLSLLHS